MHCFHYGSGRGVVGGTYDEGMPEEPGLAPLSFSAARQCVLEKVKARRTRASETEGLPVERVPLGEAAGRVLARPILADRNYPPVDRSTRDGFAIRRSDAPGSARCIGEVRAGQAEVPPIGEGECVEIMTGAKVPEGAEAVVMVEHVRREGERILIDRSLSAGENINRAGSEAAAGQCVVAPGTRLLFNHIAMLATVGCTEVEVYARPRVAILATGDEVVEVSEEPEEAQVRNSNSYSVAAQVAAAGGVPEILPVAKDNLEATRALVRRGLEADLLLLSGGVSAGKYDLVEQVLAEFGAEFYFTRVKVQPGQPLVFGEAAGKFFFGLPGNPASTMVTFAVFARAAVELLSGLAEPRLPFFTARLTAPFSTKPGLTRFLPAELSADGERITPIGWAGSSDVTALARANAFLVVPPERTQWAENETIQVLPHSA